MIKKIVEVSSRPTRLRVRDGQLVLTQDNREVSRLPCEDVGVLLVDQVASTYTHRVLTELLSHGAVVVLCGCDHLPAGLLLPLSDHHEWAARQRVQVEASLPLRKRLWQQIVRQKILRQAGNLPGRSSEAAKLRNLAGDVRSGDPTNVEAQAARVYWTAIFRDSFRRRPRGAWPNPALDYGYAVVRAAVARAVVSAGLNPAFSLFHENRRNPFALADDLVEPFRPAVDAVVRSLEAPEGELTADVKQELLSVLFMTVRNGERSGPLMVELHRLCADLWRCYNGESRKLAFPNWQEQCK